MSDLPRNLEYCPCCEGTHTDANGIEHHYHEDEAPFGDLLLLGLTNRLETHARSHELSWTVKGAAVTVILDGRKLGLVTPIQLYTVDPACIMDRSEPTVGEWMDEAATMFMAAIDAAPPADLI